MNRNATKSPSTFSVVPAAGCTTEAQAAVARAELASVATTRFVAAEARALIASDADGPVGLAFSAVIRDLKEET